MLDPNRKIPYNYTSADDKQIIQQLFSPDLIKILDELNTKTDTGRSSRLLYRFMGDLFIIKRNPFLFQELVEHPFLRNRLFSQFKNELHIIEENANDEDVIYVLDQCKNALSGLKSKVKLFSDTKKRILKYLGPVIGRDNIYFDPFNIIAHATDATDWRLHTPIAILRPFKESQVKALISKVEFLDYHIIPRGAGTGLTGGATPLNDRCLMINTEKLNQISEILFEKNEMGEPYAAVKVEAGVITQDVIDYVKKEGYIFATDPTSAWACTIGGNISENAGGKTAVLYGTAIDNVLSYNIAMPNGISYKVQRKNHPQHKIFPKDIVAFEIYHEDGYLIKTIEISGEQIRKKGLGKDVTNKFLNGLFGVQKEGCDGIITSAKFILYPEFKFKKTMCIEFFGNDMAQAGQVISQTCKSFIGSEPSLIALEHFDEEYIKAIKYKTKTSIGTRLIAVLLIDMVANNQGLLQQGLDQVKSILESFDKSGLSIARDEIEAQRFWQDRKRLGAIAAHTNAFKLNEDIVLPIDSLSDFAQFIDDFNIKEKKYNQNQIIHNIIEYLDTAIPLADPELLKKRVGQAKDLAYKIRKKLDIASRDALEASIHSNNFYNHCVDSLRGYTQVLDNVEKIFQTSKSRLIVIATHMHAGDGNVHVNIPVLSNDRFMMKRAAVTADKIMEKAVELKGVVSGEHGIGITKFKHLNENRVLEFNQYRQKVDPNGLMNPLKLSDMDIIDQVFTPSFNLLELEAKILKHGSLSDLASNIANCVRCGRCKPQCPVFYPDKNMFFHPRNKNLSIAALIEAMLYITQRTQSTGFKVLKNIEQIADHCTICHKCFDKCPVNIDSGDISIEERNILRGMGFKHTSLATKMTLEYLANKNETFNSVARSTMLKGGAILQRTGAKLTDPLNELPGFKKNKLGQLLKSPVSLPDNKPLSAFLPSIKPDQSIVLNPEGIAEYTVFYFPGCGSERLYSKISMASLFLLLKNNVRVVLPPANMCCGYPFKVNADNSKYDKVTLENVIIFSQIRDMFQDLNFDACIVSCGTCKESLTHIDLDGMFESKIVDISQFILSIDKSIHSNENYLYHTPCHDSLNNTASNILAPFLNGNPLIITPHCCSEAGTMALSRPDISNAMLERKEKAVKSSQTSCSKILTNCPSCIQGLGRIKSGNIKPIHLACELALLKGGISWETQFKHLVKTSEVVTF